MCIIKLVNVLYYKIIQESIILSFISKFAARPFNSLASFVTYTIGQRCDEMLNSGPGHCIYHRKFLRYIALFILVVVIIFILLQVHFNTHRVFLYREGVEPQLLKHILYTRNYTNENVKCRRPLFCSIFYIITKNRFDIMIHYSRYLILIPFIA